MSQSAQPNAQDFSTEPLTDPDRADAPRAPRVVTILMVARLEIQRGDWPCRIRNVSASGMMVETAAAIAVGEQVRIELRNSQVIGGKVVWTEAPRAGIQFAAPVNLAVLLGKKPGPRPRAPRLSTMCPARIRMERRTGTAMLLDLSQGGGRLQTSLPLRPGDQLTITVPGFPAKRAGVRWVRRDQAGIAFVEMLPFAQFADWLQDSGQRYAGRHPDWRPAGCGSAHCPETADQRSRNERPAVDKDEEDDLHG